jgi:N-acetylmuramoyl-L-alanine amidase
MRKTLLSLFIIILSFAIASSAQAASPALKSGMSGGEVWDLQFRLNILGYYNQPLDGKFGSQTEKAVRQFQKNYGLSADGVVGASTWKMLKRVSVNAPELTMLARIVHGEARGEPYIGQVAVAAVVMNRLQSPLFPDTVSGVIFQPGAFTAVDDGQYWLTPNKTAYAAAWEAVRGWDPTGNALYYFNPETATSKWIWSRPQTKKIGKHIFAK